jgi:signal transduction histidine kinase
VERACFRVVHESLSNVLHFAKATDVWIHLHQDADKLVLRIRDNGIGFALHAVREKKRRDATSLGLFGMQMRAKHVGGSVQINSLTGAGTEILATFPLQAAAAQAA